MEEVRPTRSELLERRGQIQLAQQGMDLLKQKRDALLIEFMSVMDETLHLSGSLQKSVSEAQYSLAVAKSVDGNVSVRSVAMATPYPGYRVGYELRLTILGPPGLPCCEGRAIEHA